MRIYLLLQELPDEGVVNLSKTHVDASHGHDGPRERPPYGVEPGAKVSAKMTATWHMP